MLILAPVHWDQFPAQLKAFPDRTYSFMDFSLNNNHRREHDCIGGWTIWFSLLFKKKGHRMKSQRSMSNAEDYLRYPADEIHTTAVATVDDEGLPVTAAIDMMDRGGSGLYFLTAKGKSFYDRLKKRPFLALTALKGEDTMSGVAVSLRGRVREPGYDRIPELLHRGNCLTACPVGAVKRR